MLYGVLKLVRFNVKEERSKRWESLGKSSGVSKSWGRSPKGPKIFSKFRMLKILRFSKLFCASVDGTFIAYFWRQKCSRAQREAYTMTSYGVTLTG